MRRSLAHQLTWVTIGVGTTGAVALVALVVITSVLHVVSRDLSTAIESVRVTDEIQVQLLTHREARSAVTRGAAEAQLRRAIVQSGELIQTNEEQQQVTALRRAVDAYLRPGAGDLEAAAAVAAARRLSSINIRQARQARGRAAAWNRLADVGGGAAAILLLVGMTWFVFVVRRRLFQHVEALAGAMKRFSGGDLDARAPETGVQECLAIAQSFNATAGALVRARQRQAEYVATAIHDLRTPLTTIQLAAGYLAPDRELPPEPRVRELIDVINRQLIRMSSLTGDILAATRIEAGELELLLDQIDLRKIASESVDLFRTLAPQHVIELVIPRRPLLVQGDRRRLEQVVNNLLSNAVKYSPFGSRVQVKLTRSGDEVVLSVSDEGPGIAPEHRAEIFETFRRRSTTHEEAPGTSLGLWVSRRIIDAHNGRIELESRVGEGSTFRVVLSEEPSSPEARAPEQLGTGA